MGDEFIDVRGSSRYDAKQSAIYLGWWEEQEFRTFPAALQNLSHGGALIQVAALPPEKSSLYLCPAWSPPVDWAEVETVDAAGSVEGSHQLRVRFIEACPYAMFQAAALGLEPKA